MRSLPLVVSVLVASLACGPPEPDGAPAPAGEEFVRGLRLRSSLMGLLFEDGAIDEVLVVERRFRLYDEASGGEPVAVLPECNTLAGRAGPCFFLSAVDPRDGSPFFERPAWLQIEVRRPGEPAWTTLAPRCRLDPSDPMFGLAENVSCEGGGVVALLPGLPLPTQAMLLDYPAEYLQGPVAMRTLTALLAEEGAPESELPLVERPPTRAFDAKRWRRRGKETDRWDMVEDLLVQHELAGMTRDEVVALLGKPASPGFPYGAAAWDMAWQVGSTFLDSFWLFVGLDGDGRVLRMRLYED